MVSGESRTGKLDLRRVLKRLIALVKVLSHPHPTSTMPLFSGSRNVAINGGHFTDMNITNNLIGPTGKLESMKVDTLTN